MHVCELLWGTGLLIMLPVLWSDVLHLEIRWYRMHQSHVVVYVCLVAIHLLVNRDRFQVSLDVFDVIDHSSICTKGESKCFEISTVQKPERQLTHKCRKLWTVVHITEVVTQLKLATTSAYNMPTFNIEMLKVVKFFCSFFFERKTFLN